MNETPADVPIPAEDQRLRLPCFASCARLRSCGRSSGPGSSSLCLRAVAGMPWPNRSIQSGHLSAVRRSLEEPRYDWACPCTFHRCARVSARSPHRRRDHRSRPASSVRRQDPQRRFVRMPQRCDRMRAFGFAEQSAQRHMPLNIEIRSREYQYGMRQKRPMDRRGVIGRMRFGSKTRHPGAERRRRAGNLNSHDIHPRSKACNSELVDRACLSRSHMRRP